MAHDSSSCLELARNGAKVYMASRTESKARDAIEKIKKAVPNADIHFLQLDLTELAAVRKAADDFLAQEKRLDILLNNAGVMAMPYEFTKDGIEIQVGTNVVGHYLFTMLLLPTLYNTSKLPEYANPDSPSVRIVQVSSMGHLGAASDTSFKDLEAVNKKHWPEFKGTWNRYGKSKLGNILIANELAKLLPSDARITNLSIHPGVVATELLRGPVASYGKIISLVQPLYNKIVTLPRTAPSPSSTHAPRPRSTSSASTAPTSCPSPRRAPRANRRRTRTASWQPSCLPSATSL